MMAKTLLFLSILFQAFGLTGLADKYDNASAKLLAGDINKVQASVDVHEIGFPDLTPTPAIKPFSERPAIGAKHYLIGDVQSNKIILKYNESEPVPIASTTKIMTAVIALENYDLDDVVTVPVSATSQNPTIIPTVVYLKPGEKITVGELLHCALIQSGNDAAYALASYLSKDGSVQEFVELMNKKALSLNMKDTHYLDPAGLNDEGHSSAEDLFILTRHAIKNKIFSEITSTKTYTAYNTTKTISHALTNSNRLVNGYDYLGAFGIKTGFTEKAGHCLVSAVEREGHTLIAVILNTDLENASASADESRKLQDWAWNNVEWN